MDRQAQILDRMVAVSIGLADFVEYNHSHVSSSRTSRITSSNGAPRRLQSFRQESSGLSLKVNQRIEDNSPQITSRS
jgi:hypothetical protein